MGIYGWYFIINSNIVVYSFLDNLSNEVIYIFYFRKLWIKSDG